MGILIGKQKLADTLKLFRFNNPPIKDLFLKFKMGNFNENIKNDFSLAKLSIGLNEIEDTTLHMALISSLIASDGISASPFLIMNRKNIQKLGNYYHKSSFIEVMKNNTAYGKIRFAMNRVVEDKNGTGRRAKKDNLRFAIKTGTAGSKKLGLDSVILGFFPYESPKFAFAIRLERAGKAELAGARFLKDFLTVVTERN
jgi:penicillin-binding protein 2